MNWIEKTLTAGALGTLLLITGCNELPQSASVTGRQTQVEHPIVVAQSAEEKAEAQWEENKEELLGVAFAYGGKLVICVFTGYCDYMP